MLHIQKNEEPQAVSRWKSKFKNLKKRYPHYEDLEDQVKTILKKALIEEQRGICCYCCSHILQETSHIEHFKPQKGQGQKYAGQSLEYNNLHASCQGGWGNKKHCGHAKKGNFDEELMISPLEPDCAQYFAFQANGHILPVDDDARARYTIDILNLDDRSLTLAREAALWAAGVFDDISPEEREKLIQKFDGSDGKQLQPYCDAILYHLRKGLESEI